MNIPDFVAFPKMARYARSVIVTEKIDGTNAQIYINDDGEILAGSRTRWIVPGDDNFGFAAWVKAHEDELRGLGPGHHFGEWWGSGIQRRYGLAERRFSLFNAIRWTATAPPACCNIVPILAQGTLGSFTLEPIIEQLRQVGSIAAPGFMRPEGVVVFHTAANVGFKLTLENDDVPKAGLRLRDCQATADQGVTR